VGLNGKICDDCEYGRHITLTCKNHPKMRWSTKNIGSIGQRSIFYTSFMETGIECDCSIVDLYHIHKESTDVGNPEG
jgi:hypothetical protein